MNLTVINQLVIDENDIAFHPMIGNSYQLNALGADVIALLKEGQDKEQITEILSTNYGVAYNTIFIDVSDFLSKLKIYGLL